MIDISFLIFFDVIWIVKSIGSNMLFIILLFEYINNPSVVAAANYIPFGKNLISFV